MFQPGELVVYGSTGVCRVIAVTTPNISGIDRNKQYYHLKPLHQDGFIYCPAENPKVSIRPVISRDEVLALIDLIPTMEADACHAPLQTLTQRYQTAVRNNDCRDLIEMMMSIYAKRQQAEAQNRRLGMVDERYMKQAERLLHGEFAAALDISFEDVPAYIAARVEKKV